MKKIINLESEVLYSISSDKVYNLPYNRNKKMKDKNINGVEYKEKIFTIHNRKVKGVFPIFNGMKITLPKHMDTLYVELGNTDSRFYNGTMKEATKALKIELEKNPELEAQFSPQQLEDIYAEKNKITGKTWHHFEELGEGNQPIMQLVDEKQHVECAHTGGSYTWNRKKFQNKYGINW